MNSIYEKWSATKLEVIARSIFTAHKPRQQNTDPDLIAQVVEKTGVDPSKETTG